MVDEAQYLNQKNKKPARLGKPLNGFGQWSKLVALPWFSAAICSCQLPVAITAMPQLQSGMLRPVIIKEVSRADVAAVVEGTAFACERAIDALHAVARLKGGLRNVANVTRIAQLFAGAGNPTPAYLKAAILNVWALRRW